MADIPGKYAEIEDKLGRPLSGFIATGRADGLSWRRLAADIAEQTGVEVSHEALRMWTHGRPAVGQGSAA